MKFFSEELAKAVEKKPLLLSFIGLFVLSSVLIIVRYSHKPVVYSVGEVATTTITADRKFEYIDKKATELKKQSVVRNIPPYFDHIPVDWRRVKRNIIRTISSVSSGEFTPPYLT